jgi:hypothetical protein
MAGLSLAIALTQHFGLEGTYNEVHPSIRFQQDAFIAGAYLNSEGHVSPYLGLRYESGRAYVEGGIVGGYSYADILPFGRAGYDFSDSVGVFVAPAFETPNRVGLVVGIELTHR